MLQPPRPAFSELYTSLKRKLLVFEASWRDKHLIIKPVFLNRKLNGRVRPSAVCSDDLRGKH